MIKNIEYILQVCSWIAFLVLSCLHCRKFWWLFGSQLKLCMYTCLVNGGIIAALHYPYRMVGSPLQMLLHHGYVFSLVYNLFPLSNLILNHTVNFF